MNFVLILVFIIAVYGCHLRKGEDDSFISLKQTASINGIFVMLVLLSHFSQYAPMGKYDAFFQKFIDQMGQLIVVTFLFYSGYGIMYSIINKEKYISTIPLRFLKLLLHFDLALVPYLIVGLATGDRYPIAIYLQALIGWRTIGNSTWYIFATLCLYVFVFIAGIIAKNRYELLVTLVSVTCVLFIFLLGAMGKADHWFNTILCFPAGMFFALCYPKIMSFFTKKTLYVTGILVSMLICLICHKLPGHIGNHYIRVFLYETKSIAFVWIIISVSWFFVIGNPILKWLGGYVFEIYILQRIPMILLENVAMNKYLYFAICVVVTLVMAVVFKKVEMYVDKKINEKLVVNKM